MNYLIIFLGAGLGGMARHTVNVSTLPLFNPGIFPFGTLFINVAGSCLKQRAPSSRRRRGRNTLTAF